MALVACGTSTDLASAMCLKSPLLLIAALWCGALAAQARSEDQAQAPPRPLTHADFDAWRSIATPLLSRDGLWLAYSVQPQDGDGELVLRELASGRERRADVGALPPPPTGPNEENPDAAPTPRAIRVVFSSDSRYLVATTYASKAETQAARQARAKPEDLPKGGLLIVDLQGTQTIRVARVKSIALPGKGGAWLAYLKEPQPQARGAAAVASVASAASAAGAAGAVTETKKDYGTEMVVRDLQSGTERSFANVLDLAWSRDGLTLLYSVSSKAETDNGVYALDPSAGTPPQALLAGKGKYGKPVWDREQRQAAFVSDRDDSASKVPAFKLYHWLRGAAAAQEKVAAATPGFPAGMTVSDQAAPAFSRDGKKLYIGAAAPPKPPPAPDAGPTDEERVLADLWRWNDDLVQPMQKVRAVLDRKRSYRGVLDLASGRYTQLADESLRTVSVSDDGQHAVGRDDRAYRRLVDYDDSYADWYVLDTRSGTRRLALRQQRDSGNRSGTIDASLWSPDGHWLLYFQGRQWHALNTSDGSSKPLTQGLGVAFQDELHDSPTPAAPYGQGGWTRDSQAALVYDRYDVWQVFVDGRPARQLTRGEGRKRKTRLTLQRIDPVEEDDEERGIDTSRPLTLRGENEVTRATGYFRTGFDASHAPQQLVWGDQAWRYLGRAHDADVLLTTASRFDRYPDLQTSKADFSALKQVSDVGAQLRPFLWGRGELMPFKNAKGVALQAAVYKPANFDPSKKHPLMVYIYERLAQNVNNFVNPAPSNGLNPSLYTSNGYVVLMPDIAYTIGHPGQSALDAVLPAIAALVKQGGIDEQAIGIQGHSWGGYQIAWMVTRTRRFRAAEAGAPVGNMTSAYSGIRWGSGLPRQFQYEQQQSRIGAPLQAALPLYIENSPVFHITKVQTPLLILANDNDDAVPWYQGIEFFLALRRYGKEAYLFNYNGQLHNLRRRADQKDFALRMNQYFDHFLKGAPAPEWMTQGIPYNDREDEKVRFGKTAAAPASAPPLVSTRHETTP